MTSPGVGRSAELLVFGPVPLPCPRSGMNQMRTPFRHWRVAKRYEA